MGEPFTKDDANQLRVGMGELVDAKLETLDERVTGLRNWLVLAIFASSLLNSAIAARFAEPTIPARAAMRLLQTLF